MVRYEKRGTPKKEAEARACATVNKETGGGKKSGSAEQRSAAARKGWETRRRYGNGQPVARFKRKVEAIFLREEEGAIRIEARHAKMRADDGYVRGDCGSSTLVLLPGDAVIELDLRAVETERHSELSFLPRRIRDHALAAGRPH